MEQDIEAKNGSEESERVARAAFWITVVGTLSFCGSIYAFVL
jgi:uncharacterized membrane protein YgdD (TMEM256/DUF423 family)